MSGLAFEHVLNGDSDKFPVGATWAFLLDGYPEPLFLDYLSQNAIRISAFREGKQEKLIEIPSLAKIDIASVQCDSKTLAVYHKDNKPAIMVSYADGAFKHEQMGVTSNTIGLRRFEELTHIITINGSYYRVIQVRRAMHVLTIPQSLDDSESSRCFSVGGIVLAVYQHEESTVVKMHEMNDDGVVIRSVEHVFPFYMRASTPVEHRYLVVAGDSQVAIIDCLTLGVTRLTYPEITGTIMRCPARIVNDNLELFLSTFSDGCRILKTSIHLYLLKEQEPARESTQSAHITSIDRTGQEHDMDGSDDDDSDVE